MSVMPEWYRHVCCLKLAPFLTECPKEVDGLLSAIYFTGCFLSTANLSQLLSPSCTVADYGLQEVTVVARSRAPGMGSALSSSDIMALQREEDKRRQQARQQHGAGTGLGLVSNRQNRSVSAESLTV